MSGYAASARLQGGSTRFMPISRSAVEDRPVSPAVDDEVRSETSACPWVSPPGPPIGTRIGARFEDLQKTWAQTTFYLFSPEGWR